MEKIGTLVENEIQKFKTKSVNLSDGITFNQYQNIRRINKYVANKFVECDDPSAMFWPLSNQRIPLYAKSIDLDTKDFYVTGIGKTNWFQQWILNVRFRKWAKDNYLSLTLNDISTGIATYGSMVWKKIYNEDGDIKIEACDLRNLYFNPTVKNIKNADVVELHYMSSLEVKKRWPEKYKKIEKREENNKSTEDEELNKYVIWERWGEFEYDDEVCKYMHFIGCGFGEDSIILVEDEVKIEDFPYYDFHGERLQGRWQGVGIVERLYTLQEQANTLVNQNNEANQIASLLLFRTADPNTTGNILQSAVSGQIINSADMSQMGVDNRFISTFLNQMQLIENKADMLCYINDSVSGETPPSGIPFRSLAVATRAATSTFKYLKTSIGEKMGLVLQEFFMPELIDKFNKEDMIEISEEETDIQKYDRMVIDRSVEKYLKDRFKKGLVGFEEDITEIKEKIKNKVLREGRREKTGKDFFDFEYGIIVNPTGESMDKNIMNQNIDAALEYMISAPAIVNTPLFQQKLANNNIPPFRLTPEEQQALVTSATGQPIPEAPKDKLAAMAEGGLTE